MTMAARDALWLAACFLALALAILMSAAACMVERAQPTVVDVPDQARLAVEDVPMHNIVAYGPESVLDTYGR